MNSVGPRKSRAKKITKTLDSEKLIIATDKGVRLTAEFDKASTKGNTNKSPMLVVLIHGWEGSSQSAYQVTTAHHLLQQGFDVLRLNMRDHGESHHLNPEAFNSTLIAEVGDAIKVFSTDRSYPSIFLAGFSLGGNFTLRIAADRGKELNISAAVAICPPIDPNNAMTAMNEGFFIYEKYFFRRWTRSISKKLACFPELNFAEDLATVKSLDDINQTFIPKFTPYPDAESYFSAYALTGNRLIGLGVTAYLIASEDDPILPVADLAKINHCDNLNIEKHRYGGHCGFILDIAGNSWVPQRLTEIFNQH
ncbi:alpha/beta fold hydrolase [Gammaproteobacteria bacterium]|nr:alpha/beta fold hydrolase [Gammaproteobacteria bacterium]